VITQIFEWIADPEIQKLLIGELIMPIFIGILAFLATNSVSVWRTRRRQSLLGVAVCDAFIEELSNGVQLLTAAQMDLDKNKLPYGRLPRRSWNGMQTISDEILERLLCLSAGRQNQGFPIRDIRIHLKNYFDHMIPNFDQATLSNQWQNEVRHLLEHGGYLDAAKGVLKMTEEARTLLKVNSSKWFPK
jgi:hypothetical protein